MLTTVDSEQLVLSRAKDQLLCVKTFKSMKIHCLTKLHMEIQETEQVDCKNKEDGTIRIEKNQKGRCLPRITKTKGKDYE